MVAMVRAAALQKRAKCRAFLGTPHAVVAVAQVGAAQVLAAEAVAEAHSCSAAQLKSSLTLAHAYQVKVVSADAAPLALAEGVAAAVETVVKWAVAEETGGMVVMVAMVVWGEFTSAVLTSSIKATLSPPQCSEDEQHDVRLTKPQDAKSGTFNVGNQWSGTARCGSKTQRLLGGHALSALFARLSRVLGGVASTIASLT